MMDRMPNADYGLEWSASLARVPEPHGAQWQLPAPASTNEWSVG